MGYESNVIIVKRNEHRNINRTYIHVEQIAQMRMCKIGPEFHELFEREGKPIDFDLYVYSGDEPNKLDCYGEHCKMVRLPVLIKYVQNQIDSGDEYRRLKPLLGLLQGFDLEQWKVDTLTHKSTLYAVHYGY